MRKLRYCDIEDQQLLDAQQLVEFFASRGFDLDVGSAICAWRRYSHACGSDWEPLGDEQQAVLSANAYLSEIFE